MNDLFADQEPVDQEELWKKQIRETQLAVQMRVDTALLLARNKTKRKALYQSWRKEFGDDIARESAKFTEALIAGKVRRPKWFMGM